MSDRAKGLLITGLGVLIITPDGLLTRLIVTDSWTLTFWRGVLSSIGVCFFLLCIYRTQTWTKIRAIGLPGLCIALTLSTGSVCFVYSITHTTVANTLFIVNTSPIFAALIAWLWLKEPVPLRTWMVIFVVLVGIGIIALGNGITNSLSDGVDNGVDGSSPLGNVMALATALIMATSFSIARRYSEINMVPATALAGFLSALLVWPLAQPTALASSELPVLLGMGLLMLPLAFALMYIGPQYIPAAEVSLMMLLEAILGPLWVWLALGEDPGAYTLVGGVIVVGALAINAAWSMMVSEA